MGAKLKAAGQNNFIILEKANAIGGTWRENTYPGAECDVPSALYSYSFAPNPTWDFKWAKQKQILSYLNTFTDDYDLRQHIQFGKTIKSANFDENSQLWTLRTLQKEVFSCRFFIPAVGQLHHPNFPEVKGAEKYSGVSFHSAQWQHDVNIADKHVAVIGNAASAIQLIPEIAKTAASVTIYQRSANWIIPKGDKPYSKFEKFLAKFIPGLAKIYRFKLWAMGEYGLYPMIKGKKFQTAYGVKKCTNAIKKHIKDPDLQKTLTPTYPIGAKRVLLSDKYYPTVAKDNVELVSAGLKEFFTSGIIDHSLKQRTHDVVVYATGFHTNPFLKSIAVVGKNKTSLHTHWKNGAFAYLGVMTANFPNMFILYGPNTNTGHTSVVVKIEAQVNYILQLIKKSEQGTIEVKENAESQFNQELQKRLQKLAWAKIDMSWYKDGSRITNNWPGSSLEYKRRMKNPDWNNYILLS